MKSRLVSAFLVLLVQFAFAQTYQVEEVKITAKQFPLDGLNTPYDDFSAAVCGEFLVFASARETSLVLAGENNWKKTGYINLFSVPLKKGLSDTSAYRNPAPFSDVIRTNNHTGPASFSVTGDTIFYTQVEPKKKNQREDRKPQLYWAVRSENTWQLRGKLPFNDAAYSFAHPSWNQSNNELYFVSDKPGGKGGKDIYRSTLNNGNWSEPENVAEINTESDEVFPCAVKNDIYFSSNREGGSGGFDLYWKVLNSAQPTENFSSLNTNFDEIGIYVSEDRKKGIFSSNPKGNDDFYFFYMERSVTMLNEMAGRFTYRNLDGVASGLQVQLYSEEGELLFTQNTDEKGEFVFRSLPGQVYTIKALSDENLELALYNSQGVAETYLLRDHEGAFQYKKIQFTDAGTLGLMDESMLDFQLKTGWITGQFAYEDDPGKHAAGLEIYLLDSNGNRAYTQITDKYGNFEFKNLSLEESYLLTVEDVDQNLVLFIFDKEGNVVAQLKQNESGSFTYRKIKADYANNLHLLAESDDVFEMNTMTLTGNFNYKKLEGNFSGGLEVMLYTEEGEYVMSTYTDEKGEFRFTSLNPAEKYLFKINEEELPFEIQEFNLFVTDRYGNVVADLYRGDKGYFIYRKLETGPENTLATKSEKDVQFTLSNPLPKEDKLVIFFEKNSSYPANEDYLQLTELIGFLKSNPSSKVIILAYADSRATDEYNLYLSEKRGNRIKDYMLRRGVNPGQIEVTAFGESKPVNQCTDEVSCDEESHSENRRVEIILQK